MNLDIDLDVENGNDEQSQGEGCLENTAVEKLGEIVGSSGERRDAEEEDEDKDEDEAESESEVEKRPKRANHLTRKNSAGGRRKNPRSNGLKFNLKEANTEVAHMPKGFKRKSAARSERKVISNLTIDEDERESSRSDKHCWTLLPGYDDVWVDMAPCDLDTEERPKLSSNFQIIGYGPYAEAVVPFFPAVHVSSSLFIC